jgi:hypothetical protein
MTHDLFKNFIQNINMDVSKVEVCDLKNNTFYARIYFSSEEKSFSIDARPSDAIAIAIRFRAPIFVDDKIIEKSQTIEADPEMMVEGEEGERWAEYLKNLDPDEFGKYKV